MSATAPQSSHAAASATKAGRPKGDHDGPAPSRRASASVTPKAYDMPHWRGLALAAALPMALLYLATASGYGGWLDSGTFIAAAVHLGIAHPPGHALAQLLHYPFTLLPCGPLAWRVAVASSVYAAIALGLTAVLLDRSLACFVGDVSPGARPATRAPAGRAQQAARHARWWRHALVLTAVWLLGLSPAWWLQAVRPEVYAAQIMLITLALERLTLTLTLRAQQSPRALAALLQAGFCWALGLSNHHFISITVLLPGLWLALQFARSHGARIWAWLAWATTTALWPLAYLPLRAGARGAFHLGRLNLGAPDDLSRFLWVVSAQAFQKNTGQGVPGELGERGESLLAVLHAHLHLGLLFTALAGAYLLLRQRHSRAFGILWLSLAIPVVLARAWLGFVRGNPDALGYLLPASLALALATLVLLVAPTVLWPRRRRLCLALATLAALAWLPAQAQRGWLQAARHRFTDTDTLSVFSLRALPARSVLVLHDPQSIFALFGQQAESGVRPDIEVVPVPLLPYPGLLGELLARSPELAAFLRHYLVRPTLSEALLQRIAYHRPTLVEADPRLDPATYPALAPAGLYLRAFADGAATEDIKLGARRQRRTYEALDRLEPNPPSNPEARARRLWRHYLETLYYAALGQQDAAQFSLQRALPLAPQSPELQGLARALATQPKGPIDIAPWRLR